jgi:non-heme chloroperoxidase
VQPGPQASRGGPRVGAVPPGRGQRRVDRPGSTVSQGLRDSFWLMCMMVGVKGAYACVKAFSETDTTEDLKKIDVPTLIIHGDDDQIVPIGAAALQSSKIVKDATLKIYPGAPHGLAQTTLSRSKIRLGR